MKKTRFFCAVLLFLFAQQLSNAQGQALTITTNATLPQVAVAEAMTPLQLKATGGTSPYTWSLVTGSQALVGKIASGLSVTPDGRIIGTPMALQAPVGFTVRVADFSSPKKIAEKVLIIRVVSATPKISLAPMGAGTVGSGYSWTFNATDGKLPYTWSSNSTFPNGLTLNSTTGVLSGSISSSQSPGNFTLAITVSGSNDKSASENFVLRINPAFAWVTQQALAGGKVATAYSTNLTVAGGKSPYSFATKNGSILPGGLTLNATTGRLSGTPTAAGNFSFTITAKDTGSPATTIERAFTLAVESYGMGVSGPATISGQQYQVIPPATYSATGGVSPYSWSTGSALPAALSINATTGLISGSLIATAGNYTVAVRVKDKGNQTATQNVTIAVAPAPSLEWVTQHALAGGKVAIAYTTNLTVTGGKSPYSFATKNGSMPPGWLTLNATSGRLSGTPTAAGNFSFTITAKDSGSPATTIERAFTLAVESYGLSVSGPATIGGQQYQVISPAIYSATGGVSPYSWSTGSALPAALSINATTGVISGSLNATAGNYTVAVRVKDKGNQTASQNVTITVAPAPSLEWVTQQALAGGKVATAYSTNLTVTGGKSPYSFATKNGSTLPGGLTLNATTGRLSGTPTAAGNFSFTIMAKDTGSPVGLIERIFTLSIASYGMMITDNAPSEIIGTQFQPLPPNTFSATGGQPTYKWSSTPTPPAAGLTLNATTGILSGVPTAAGNTTLAVKVTDGANQAATKNCTIRILPAGNLTITTANPLPSATVNASYSTTLAASGGKPFLTTNQSTYCKWAIAAQGNLPTNFTLNATTGILSGTANAALTANFSVKVTDAANAFVTKNYTLQIAAPSGVSDLDKDGVNDYRELYDGTDPNNPQSFDPLSVGLLAHYPLDGNAKDESGFNFDGRLEGVIQPAIDKFNKSSSALKFDGSPAAVKIDHAILNLGQDAYSISSWFICDDVNLSPQTIFNTHPHTGIGVSYVHPHLNGARFGWWIGRVGEWIYSNPGINMSESKGIWYHWILVKDGTSYKFYIDGVLASEENVLESENFDQQVSLILGSVGSNNYYGYETVKGSIDETRIYNRALSAAEVSQLYSEESGEPNMALVQGGTLPAGSALANQTVSAFHIARFETTWAEWKKVRTWAAANGYDIGTAGQGSADNHPVRNVSWYDAVKWCNAMSEMDGLTPVYTLNGTTYKTGQSIPTPLTTANGYRLPTESEWEWAARGGVASNGYSFSGSNNINEVAWVESNSINASVNLAQGRGTWPLGQKAPNELGLFDMSGNVWEWLWDAIGGFERQITGGSWNHSAERALSSDSDGDPADFSANSIGFRYVRNAIGDMVTVQGGTLPAGSGLAGQKVQAFQIGRTEVTWDEWKSVRDWAAENGYADLAETGSGNSGGHPVTDINWYSMAKWCNAKSQREGLEPAYTVSGLVYKTGQYDSVLNPTANGYRLPLEPEWEWAARGGIRTQGHTHSGSNEANLVAWTRENSPLGARQAGLKQANELGLFDMSGNVWEWCHNPATASARRFRGGDWGNPASYSVITSRDIDYAPVFKSAYGGFRLARNIGPKISIIGTLPEATLNQAYAGYNFGAVGSTGNNIWTISEGTLPPGMSFSTYGTLSGTPMTAGTYSFVIRVDAEGYSDEVEVEVKVNSPKNYAEMTTVQGGTLPAGSELGGQQVSTFQIGKYEVTWGEWKSVRDWAVVNGYTDLTAVGDTYPSVSADNFPVTKVNWYDVVKWCNAKSQKEGLSPVYQINGATYKVGQSAPIPIYGANGYRLPSEAEWEWAARGGVNSQGFTFSGSNQVWEVAWCLWYSYDGTRTVGAKAANELGIFDMSGNVLEWCWDEVFPGWFSLRGGAYCYEANYCAVGKRMDNAPYVRDTGGIRLARSITQNTLSALHFRSSTDIVQIPRRRNLDDAVTIEAIVKLDQSQSAGSNGNQSITNLYVEDSFGLGTLGQMNFGVTTSGLVGFVAPNYSGEAMMQKIISISKDKWQHVAYVVDSISKNLYLDGNLVFSRPSQNQDIYDNPISCFLGNGWLGYISSFRISNTARYSGNTYSIPNRKLSSDSSTFLLYNFTYLNRTTILDESGNGRNGVLGGITSAENNKTAPTPEFVE